MAFQCKVDLVIVGGRECIREHDLVVKAAWVNCSAFPQLSKHLHVSLPMVGIGEVLLFAAHRVGDFFKAGRHAWHLAVIEVVLLGLR